MKKILISVYVFVIFLVSFGNTETIPPKWSENQKNVLLIGLIPERNIFEQMERYEPLAEYLSEKIGINIKLTILTRYGNIIDNFVSLGLDGAFFGSFTYTLAHAKLGVIPVARPQSVDGTSTYYGMIFVRRDSGIKTAKDMQGKTFAFVDKATTAGHLLPLAYFKANGIKDYKTYLKETYFTGTHDDAIYDVLDKKADIGAAKNTVYYKLAQIDNRILQDLLILERSPDVPENGLAVRKDLDVSVKNKMKEALLNMVDNADGRKVLKEFGAKRFIDTTNDEYSGVYNYLKEIELDIATYDYIND
jgi:phosphonate transport system substrate-binding protein